MFDDLRTQLKMYRATRNLSQAAVGALIGADQASISAFETGAKNLGPDKIERLMQIMGLHLIQGEVEKPTNTKPLMREHTAPYEPSREVPIPSPEQLEFALALAHRLGDEKTTKVLHNMQMQILGTIEELREIGDTFTKLLKTLEHVDFESERRLKDAIDY